MLGSSKCISLEDLSFSPIRGAVFIEASWAWARDSVSGLSQLHDQWMWSWEDLISLDYGKSGFSLWMTLRQLIIVGPRHHPRLLGEWTVGTRLGRPRSHFGRLLGPIQAADGFVGRLAPCPLVGFLVLPKLPLTRT